MSPKIITGRLMAGDIISNRSSTMPRTIANKDGATAYRVVGIHPLKVKRVHFYIGFGWLTVDELAELRHAEPRIAP